MDVNVWLERLHSESTREAYGRWFNRFLEFHGCTAEETLTWDVEKAEDELVEFKEHLIGEKLSGQTVNLAWSAVKKWFKANRIKVDVKCEGVRRTKTYLDYFPTKEDLRRLLEACNLNYKVAVSLIAFSGMRPVDVRNLKYLSIKRSYEAGDKILTIQIRQEKTGEWYVTYLGPQGLRYLRRLLEQRKKNGEVIKDETLIVTNKGKMLSRKNLRWYLKDAIRRSVGRHPTGESFRLFRSYGLRKYFRRVARKLGEDTAEFLMGHVKGMKSLTATYSGLKDLDQTALEEIKREYAKILPELETELSEETVSEELDTLRHRVREQDRVLKKLWGLTQEGETDLLGQVFKRQTRRVVKEDKRFKREEQEQRERDIEASRLATNGGRPIQKVIDEGAVEDYLNRGWRYVGSLNAGKVIVEKT